MAVGRYQRWLEPDGLTLLEGWARDGLTDEQIAHNAGITTKTLYEWKKKHGAICDALKKGKEVVDFEVENALFKRALGYTATEIIEERLLNQETGKYELFITKKITKDVPPDSTALIYWLKNRKPDIWRDKREAQGEKSGASHGGVVFLAPVDESLLDGGKEGDTDG